MKCDQEQSIMAIAGHVRDNRTASTAVQPVQRADHQALGVVERANGELGKQVRALKIALETKLGARVETSHHMMPG